MTTRKCSACGASVKLENLVRHFSSVHPHLAPPALSEVERREARPRVTRPRPFPPIRWSSVGVVALVLILVAAGAAAVYIWRPPNPDEMKLHIHPRLAITINGAAQGIPANIGISPAYWNDHSLDDLGMEGMSPLHTHDLTGLIHVESRVVRDYTIGEFFRVWGQSFDSTQVLGHAAGPGHSVRMVVDGVEMAPANTLVLRDGMDIRIICDVG